MKSSWPLLAVLAVGVAHESLAAEPPASLTHYRCYICHADHETLVGPAFSDIAAAYRGRKDAVDRISRDIRAGMRSGGPWHMPPHPEISPREAREMARYIMSVPPADPKARQIVHPSPRP